MYGERRRPAPCAAQTESHAMPDRNRIMPNPFAGEPALDDVFADPIVQAVMRVDGLAEADLRRTLCEARGRRGTLDRPTDET